MAGKMNAVIKSSDMDQEMTAFAVAKANEGLKKFCTENEIASYLKRQFEEEYQHTWHAFVGYNFSSFVTHEAGKYIYFYIGQKGFVIFSTS
mmetsp:Transcript_54346/g.80598  ORF Transcript_54346/g.80598 Transcript_54346/m.80598 type:complete len:91 (+) Transcript_54346:109-381(+)|eukprot:CAMPEP_0195530264 /NCGR_PEP_ID=MMETSP0794_2-20130614/33108_1 /TAXON_ID=515487 /ORGANISM="Stephanopyxis turris, Strain CCMP 815" /LENGTH=90 /DNA_ID=CAMNT_0040661739 /DNA_START=88 /DNA_END=360 /DNA_ORIENTATION=-